MADGELFHVFVSRIPGKWTKALMLEHFLTLGLEAVSAEIFTRRVKVNVKTLCYQFKNEGRCDSGESCRFTHQVDAGEETLSTGTLSFASEKAMLAALELGTIHVAHKTIKLSPFVEEEERRGGMLQTVCFAYERGSCVKGDSCKFSHDGPGGCIKVGEAFQGRKYQCISFKKKGKCSKGDKCPFIHDASKVKSKAPVDEHAKEQQMCRNWQKYGACKRENCMFLHAAAEPKGVKNDEQPTKRKIDGKVLVELRRAKKTKIDA
jgi:hypothetical protein